MTKAVDNFDYTEFYSDYNKLHDLVITFVEFAPLEDLVDFFKGETDTCFDDFYLDKNVLIDHCVEWVKDQDDFVKKVNELPTLAENEVYLREGSGSENFMVGNIDLVRTIIKDRLFGVDLVKQTEILDVLPDIVKTVERFGNFPFKEIADIKFHPETYEELKELCDDLSVNLGDIDTSRITDISELFYRSERTDFSGMENWDVSNVTNMSWMFAQSEFNGDISKWDVSNVRDMRGMFAYTRSLNSDISKWDVSNVKDMSFMFSGTQFNGDLSKWDVSNVEDMSCMFAESQFNRDISEWDVSNVENMQSMFSGSNTRRNLFNGDISKWDISNVTNMSEMFCKSDFNGDLSKWDVSNVTNMFGMFISSGFNGDISQWDVSNVKNMSVMFWNSAFNRNISKWDVSNVENMESMFESSQFNGDISDWDVSNVKSYKDIFSSCPITSDKVPEKFKSLVQQEQQEVKKGRSR